MRDRIIGTHVVLIGYHGNTTCGWVNQTLDDARSAQDQTYSVICGSGEDVVTRAVWMVDREAEGGFDGSSVLMNIAGVTVHGNYLEAGK